MSHYTDVYLDDQVTGTAEIIKKGLYYHIHCRCKISNNRIHRLMANCGGRIIDLGICVPFADGFGVDTMVSVRNMGTDKVTLFLTDKKEYNDEIFLQLHDGKPFGGIDLLVHARFEKRDDVPGLVIKEV